MNYQEFIQYFKDLPKYMKKDLIVKGGLKNKYTNILMLYYVDELDYQSLSERLGLTYNSIGNELTTARKRLYKVLSCFSFINK